MRGLKHSRKLPLRKRLARMAICLAAGVLLLAAIILSFGGAILNGYGKGKMESAFAKAYPGAVLRIGELDYSVGANRLVAQSVSLTATNVTLKVSRISVTGVDWTRLLRRTAALADLLAMASLEATNLEVAFPRAHYEIRCVWLRASAPRSELIAEGTELRTLIGDEDFFAAHEFRATRFHVVVPECRVLGLAYGELLRGKSCRARSIDFSRPTFDALVNRDKPAEPFVKPPLMAHEALASIPQPFQVDNLIIADGRATYRERVVAGADPGVLTFGAVNVFAEGIANRGAPSAAILLQAQADLMDAATLKLRISIPILPSSFSLHYDGSISAMDLTCLNAYLEIAERTRIKSGHAQDGTFEIDVIDGHARGHLRAIYEDLVMAVLDKKTDTEKGLDNRLASFFANLFKIRKSNVPDAAGSIREGEVNYTRRPEDEFLQFAWFALRTGVLDVMSH